MKNDEIFAFLLGFVGGSFLTIIFTNATNMLGVLFLGLIHGLNLLTIRVLENKLKQETKE